MNNPKYSHTANTVNISKLSCAVAAGCVKITNIANAAWTKLRVAMLNAMRKLKLFCGISNIICVRAKPKMLGTVHAASSTSLSHLPRFV